MLSVLIKTSEILLKYMFYDIADFIHIAQWTSIVVLKAFLRLGGKSG